MSFVGIDVSKSRLDFAVRPGGEQWSIANSEAEICKVMERLAALLPQVIVVEATGGMETPLVAALSHKGLPVVVVNPPAGTGFRQGDGAFGQDRPH